MFFDNTDQVRELERFLWRSHWCGPEKEFERWKETLIARFKKIEGTDGQDVEVYCTTTPARFFTIKAIATDDKPEFKVETASGEGNTALSIAEAISQGTYKPEAER